MDMDVVDKIAELIKENPSITVQEISTRLGYSEEKSVYYWLNKARYAGIKDFRKAVLTGRYRPGARRYPTSASRAGEARESGLTPRLPPDVPLVGSFDDKGRPLATGEGVELKPLPASSRVFAYRPGLDYSPLILPDDVLIVDLARAPAHGDLVLCWDGGPGAFVLRYYVVKGAPFFINPATGVEPEPGDDGGRPILLGAIIQMLRAL